MNVIKRLVMKTREILPPPVTALLKKLGVEKLQSLAVDKCDVELSFQEDWAREFVANKQKVLEYWQKYRFLNEIEDTCELNGEKRVLDVGCGISSVLHYVDGERFGIDPLADEYVKLYDYPETINLQKGSGEDLPFPDEFFDIVFCSNVLDHTTDPEQVVVEIWRVLRSAGFLILTVEIFKEDKQRDLSHPHSFTEEEVYSLMGDKFSVVFHKKSPWIGLRKYVSGVETGRNQELVMILKKQT